MQSLFVMKKPRLLLNMLNGLSEGRSKHLLGLPDLWPVASAVSWGEVWHFLVSYLHWLNFLVSQLKNAIKYVTGAESPGPDANGNSFDFTTKLLHLAWHPSENSIACAAANSLYMYYA